MTGVMTFSRSTMDQTRMRGSAMSRQTTIRVERKHVKPRQTRFPKGHARVRTRLKPCQYRCSQEMPPCFGRSSITCISERIPP
jgi:hypothetical protein